MTRRVLIADDEPGIVVSLEHLLSREGHDVLVAGDGQEALAMVEREFPDLVVLDVMLPRLDGFEVCRRIRARPELQQVRIMMLTAKGRPTDVAKGLELGADAYLTKPFSTTELMATVRRLLR